MNHRYEVHTWTLCDGWVNCWTNCEVGDERPITYATVEAAQSELAAAHAQRIINPELYRIYDTTDGVYVTAEGECS